MSEQTKPTLLIFGATGAQGGSVVDYLLATNKYNLRAVSRNTQSEKALELAKRGVEVLTGDFVTGIPASVYQGVYGVFLVTNFWDASSMGKEYEQSVPIIDAALAAGVKQFVYSTLPNSHSESNGKYTVEHFSTKAKIEDYIKTKGFEYTAFPAAAFYYQNFQSFFPPKADESGNYSITMPYTTRIASFDVSQLGGVVAAIFADPAKFNGQFVAVAGEDQAPQYYVDAISEKTGKKIALNLVPIEIFATFPFPGAADMADMFGWFTDYGYFGKNEIFAGKKVDPTLREFKSWLDHVNFTV